MAHSGFIIALSVGAALGLLFLLQLVVDIDLPIENPSPAFSPSHFDEKYKTFLEASRADDDSVFLLGAGKADITG
jgi:neutral ceramidase